MIGWDFFSSPHFRSPLHISREAYLPSAFFRRANIAWCDNPAKTTKANSTAETKLPGPRQDLAVSDPDTDREVMVPQKDPVVLDRAVSCLEKARLPELWRRKKQQLLGINWHHLVFQLSRRYIRNLRRPTSSLQPAGVPTETIVPLINGDEQIAENQLPDRINDGDGEIAENQLPDHINDGDGGLLKISSLILPDHINDGDGEIAENQLPDRINDGDGEIAENQLPDHINDGDGGVVPPEQNKYEDGVVMPIQEEEGPAPCKSTDPIQGKSQVAQENVDIRTTTV
eukprot:gene10902-19731_t